MRRCLFPLFQCFFSAFKVPSGRRDLLQSVSFADCQKTFRHTVGAAQLTRKFAGDMMAGEI